MSRLIIQQPIIHLPAPKEFELSRSDLYSRLQKVGIGKIYLWDGTFFYISHTDWGKVFKDVLFGMPKYLTDKVDCENFAMIVSARVTERYKLNTCGIAIGDSPQGRHGFNIFLSEMGLYYLEPQNGDVFPVSGNSGYRAEIVIFS